MNYISFKAVTRFELNAEIHRFLYNHPGIEIINMSYSTHNARMTVDILYR